MSVIGPRPGLWNQDVLTAERDKYNAIKEKKIKRYEELLDEICIAIPEYEYLLHCQAAGNL